MLTRLGCTAILIAALAGCSYQADENTPAVAINDVSVGKLREPYVRIYDDEFGVVCYAIRNRGTSVGSAISCLQVQP